MTTQAHIAEAISHFKGQAEKHGYETDLCEAHVLSCVSMYKGGWTLVQLEAHFKLSDDTVRCIRRIVSH